MKSEVEIKDILYNIIKNSDLHGAITGSLYKNSRPVNSTSEDIVISILDGLNGQFQDATVNVNIYVQDVLRGEDKVENDVHIRELSQLAINLFEVVSLDGCRMELEKQPILKIDGVDEHCINNKIKLLITNF